MVDSANVFRRESVRSYVRACSVGPALLLLAACFGHSFPAASTFPFTSSSNDPLPANVAHVFVDANGTLYPSGWTAHLRPRRPWSAHSLLNESDDEPAFRALIEADEERQLDQIASFVQNRKRVFVLIHGYNNTVADTAEPYRLLEERIAPRADDAVIRFGWDGLTGQLVGAGTIWFKATGYSQLAGSRGLRRLLNRISDKDVYLIAHSRGASVVLSALANPVYDPGFLRATREVAATWRGKYSLMTSPPPLQENGNRLHILLLAPAVDRIDFCDQSEQPQVSERYICRRLKDLSDQVRSFRYTINRRDPTLNKFVGLSGGFNPTGLGVRPEVGEVLRRERYQVMRAYVFEPAVRSHDFSMYAVHPTFGRMLADEGLTATD